MILPSWKNVISILLIFLSGAVFGALLFSRITPLLYLRSAPSQREVLRRIDLHMARQLDLSAAQREQIRQIMAEGRQEIQGMRLENQPKIREVLAKIRERIRQQLTPEQQKRFMEMIRRQKKQLDKRLLPAP